MCVFTPLKALLYIFTERHLYIGIPYAPPSLITALGVFYYTRCILVH